MITINKRLIGILVAIGLLLLLPLIAMQFTAEVHWTAADFLVAGGLLLSTGLGCEWMLRKVKNRQHRLLILMGILAVFFLVWAELAVGIFGTPLAGS